MLRRVLMGLAVSGWLLVAVSATGADTAGNAAADPGVDPGTPRVIEHRLDNGLTVLVLEDARAPVVTHQAWYRVGSMDEHSGISGVSHMLEHMMFKGSEAYAPGEFSRIVARLGGQENAFTGRDYTGYYQLLGREHWETVMAMEAERMHALQLTEVEFLPERRVVIEERRLVTEDRPNSLLREQFYATAFFNHPYGHPVIGWMTDIEAYTVEDLQAWYDAWYAPNNAVVVVVGDVDPDAVIAAAERHFGPIPARELPARKPRVETPQRGERRTTVRVPAELPYLMMGWKAPALTTLDDPADAYALIVAAGILNSGEASRFSRELVRGQELASSTSAGYSAFNRYDSLFTVAAVPTSGTELATLERALLDQIDRLKQEPVDSTELERVQARVIAAEIFQRDSIRAQAFELGMLQTVGLGWQVADEYVDRIRKVTAEDVQRVVREYLVPDRLTVGQLQPLPLGDGA
jgi:zinc protease